MTRFCLRFLLIAGVLFILLNTVPDAWFPIPLNLFTARITGILLSFIGIPAIVRGMEISHAGFSIKIIMECTAVHIILLFISFVLSYPASRKQRINGILIGATVLLITNIFRIAGIFLIGLRNETLFQYAHVYIGQIFMVILLILLTLVWLKSLVSVSVNDSPIGFFIRFLSFSCLLFFVWLFLAKPFVLSNYLLVKALLSVFHVTLYIPDTIQLYPHTFNSFQMVGYAALVLSTKSIDKRKKRSGLIIGLLILWLVYFLFLLFKTLLFALNIKPVEIPFIALILFNQWILPFTLWIAIIRKEIFKPNGIYKCPICGAEKRGIIEHIRSKHGETALGGHDIQVFLKNEGVGLLSPDKTDLRA